MPLTVHMPLPGARRVLHPHSPAVVTTSSPPAILAPALERGRPTTSAAGAALAVSPAGKVCLSDRVRRVGDVSCDAPDARAIGSVRLMAMRRLMVIVEGRLGGEGGGGEEAVKHKWGGGMAVRWYLGSQERASRGGQA